MTGRVFLALTGLLVTASAQPDEVHRDPIHSDLPLWAGGRDGMWPRPFTDGDSFGCQSRVPFGDWRLEDHPDDEQPTWYRLTNYGVFHCFMWVRDADDREALGGREPDASFFVELGTARGREGRVELWALQRGPRPGSDYLLLARTAADGPIAEFEVLQRRCPRARMRQGPPLSILLTSYCAINSRVELRNLARQMVRLPPLGRLTFFAPPEDED